MTNVAEFHPAPAPLDGSHEAGAQYDPAVLAAMENGLKERQPFNAFAKPDIYAQGTAHEHQVELDVFDLTPAELANVNRARAVVAGVVSKVAVRMVDPVLRENMEKQAAAIGAPIQDAVARYQLNLREQIDMQRQMDVQAKKSKKNSNEDDDED